MNPAAPHNKDLPPSDFQVHPIRREARPLRAFPRAVCGNVQGLNCSSGTGKSAVIPQWVLRYRKPYKTPCCRTPCAALPGPRVRQTPAPPIFADRGRAAPLYPSELASYCFHIRNRIREDRRGPSGFRHRAFPIAATYREALKAEADAHPVLHDAPSRTRAHPGQGRRTPAPCRFVHKIRSFAINGESHPSCASPRSRRHQAPSPSSHRRALRSVPSGKPIHKVQHGKFVGVALPCVSRRKHWPTRTAAPGGGAAAFRLRACIHTDSGASMASDSVWSRSRTLAFP